MPRKKEWAEKREKEHPLGTGKFTPRDVKKGKRRAVQGVTGQNFFPGNTMLKDVPIDRLEATPENDAVIERAVEVIGDRKEAMRWLGTPVRALNYATPISRLYDAQGQDDVLRVLAQLEHGVL